jgi:adenine-specific DNA-methyltransferase
MNYIGSKRTLLPFIEETIVNTVGNDLTNMVFCDLFAGTGIVGIHFKDKVKKIISNDFEYYSYILNKNYICNKIGFILEAEYIYQLNLSPPMKGFIYNNYCIGSGSGRMYFSDENGMKIDSIRTAIDILFNGTKEITENVYYFLLSSLIESADKVANVASVYGAFLKEFKNSAKKELKLEPALFKWTDQDNEVFNEDSNELIHKINGDILYIDPPYNERNYGSNYHILNTIAKNEYFVPRGKTGLDNYKRSKYYSKNTAENTFEDLIKNAKFKYIFVSYNNEGFIPFENIGKIMSKYGEYSFETIDYKRFKADTKRDYSSDSTKEYLHILKI